MTVAEFKAWFEGFTECMDGPPDEKQWAKIKARVKDVDGVAVTLPVYIDRYRRDWVPYWSSPTITLSGGSTSGVVYCSSTAMRALGQADAASLT